MPAFFLQLAQWLMNPKTIGYVIVGLIALVIAGYGFWSWETIKSLRTRQAALVTANQTLVQNNNILVDNDKQLQAKMNAISQNVTVLTGQFSSSQQSQQQSFQNIVTPSPAPGQAPNTQDMENRANTGTNTVFSDLNTLSQTAAHGSKK